jgi:hypothetical protein
MKVVVETGGRTGKDQSRSNRRKKYRESKCQERYSRRLDEGLEKSAQEPK